MENSNYSEFTANKAMNNALIISSPLKPGRYSAKFHLGADNLPVMSKSVVNKPGSPSHGKPVFFAKCVIAENGTGVAQTKDLVVNDEMNTLFNANQFTGLHTLDVIAVVGERYPQRNFRAELWSAASVTN